MRLRFCLPRLGGAMFVVHAFALLLLPLSVPPRSPLIGGASLVHAQPVDPAALPDVSLAHAVASRAAVRRDADLPAPAAVDEAALRRLQLESRRPPRAELIEIPEVSLTGKPMRSHHALAFESAAMRSLAQGLGLEAERCLAPMLRMHNRLASAGSGYQLNSTVWLHARCSLR